jgi:thiamine monophosphate synthase
VATERHETVLDQERGVDAFAGVREDVAEVRAAGGAGVAVVSGILGAEDVETAARRYAEAWPRREAGSP